MIDRLSHITYTDKEMFFKAVQQNIKCMQKRGLICEVQYSVVNDNGLIVYTALIIGRFASK